MDQFNFFQHWYPVALLEDIDPTAPKAITIFGKQLVIWKPRKADHYSVFLDQCPHRLAPLSEGRVDEKSDRLMCSYHGWEFDGDGNCAKIPQANTPDLLEKQGENFCAMALPTQEKQAVLWVWLDRETKDLADQTPLPLSLNVDTEKGFHWSTYARELEYDWLTLVENIVDPSHVPFAHHGLQGRRERGSAMIFEIIESNIENIKAKVTSGLKTSIIFKPPCLIEYEISFAPTKQFGLVTYCIPTTPGKSRIIAFFLSNMPKKKTQYLPRWLEHYLIRSNVLDSDMILLQNQEYFLQQRQKKWTEAYKMPASADRLIIEFRRWFDTHCDGKLPWDKVGIQPQPISIHQDRPQMLDRYHQHTIHCRSCRTVLQRTKWAKRILIGMAIATIGTTAVLPNSVRIKLGLGLLSFGGICGAIAAVLHYKFEPGFHFIDYRHQDKK